MKTSTKLLTIFFISIPVSLFAYNWLLKEQYVAGKLEEFIYRDISNMPLVERTLPAFKHLVIDATLRSGEIGASENYDPRDWWPNIVISKAQNSQQQSIKVNRLFESLLQTRVNNDTLYIGFYRDKRVNASSNRWFNRFLYIQVDHVTSISSRHGNYTIDSLVADSMKVTSTGGGEVTFYNNDISKLEILAKGSRIKISNGNKVKELHYSLANSSNLDIHNLRNRISELIPGSIDTSATLSLTGKALAAHNKMEL